MVPTITEQTKDLDNYDTKFKKLVNNLHSNQAIVFIGKGEEPKAVLINERTYEKIESYLETLDILLNEPKILEELHKADKELKKAKAITLDEFKNKYSV